MTRFSYETRTPPSVWCTLAEDTFCSSKLGKPNTNRIWTATSCIISELVRDIIWALERGPCVLESVQQQWNSILPYSCTWYLSASTFDISQMPWHTCCVPWCPTDITAWWRCLEQGSVDKRYSIVLKDERESLGRGSAKELKILHGFGSDVGRNGEYWGGPGKSLTCATISGVMVLINEIGNK